MFDIDQFVADCKQAATDPHPCQPIREVLERALTRPQEVADALPASRAEIVPLYLSEELSVLKVVWGPRMRFHPHNHLMWVAIGLYGGQEHNTFYRRGEGGIEITGDRALRTGDVAVLKPDVIHAVRNPEPRLTGAIHIYGGNITNRPGRREWLDPGLTEVDYDFERARRAFAEAQGG